MYRSLLRAAAKMDQDFATRALLTSKPSMVFDRARRKTIKLRGLNQALEDHWDGICRAYLGNELWRPGRADTRQGAKELVRHYFREGASSFTNDDGSRSDGLDMAFFALRRIQSTLELRDEITNPENRAADSERGDQTGKGERTGGLRSAEVALLEATVDLLGLTHVQDPEAVGPGSFLVTHPTSCITQPVLHQAVILLTDGNGESHTTSPTTPPAPNSRRWALGLFMSSLVRGRLQTGVSQASF